MSDNVRINYKEIIDTLKTQVNTLLYAIRNATNESDPFLYEISDMYKNIKVEVADEQTYVKTKIDPNTFYVVAKFGDASTNFGAAVCPVTLSILGNENQLKPAQTFFSLFVSAYSVKEFLDGTQIWLTPRVTSNFNEVNAGLRTLFNVSGTLVLGQKPLRLKKLLYIYYDETSQEEVEEPIAFLAFNDGLSNALNPQPFGNTGGFAKSETNFSTYSFSIVTYALDNRLNADLCAMKGFRDRRTDGKYAGIKTGPNHSFKFVLEFSNGFTNDCREESEDSSDEVKGKEFYMTFKLASATNGEKLGEIPTLNLGFSR